MKDVRFLETSCVAFCSCPSCCFRDTRLGSILLAARVAHGHYRCQRRCHVRSSSSVAAGLGTLRLRRSQSRRIARSLFLTPLRQRPRVGSPEAGAQKVGDRSKLASTASGASTETHSPSLTNLGSSKTTFSLRTRHLSWSQSQERWRRRRCLLRMLKTRKSEARRWVPSSSLRWWGTLQSWQASSWRALQPCSRAAAVAQLGACGGSRTCYLHRSTPPFSPSSRPPRPSRSSTVPRPSGCSPCGLTSSRRTPRRGRDTTASRRRSCSRSMAA